MRLTLLSPGEMNESQRQTYDESIAGKRGKPPAPMMAWLSSPEMARHATRLGMPGRAAPKWLNSTGRWPRVCGNKSNLIDGNDHERS